MSLDNVTNLEKMLEQRAAAEKVIADGVTARAQELTDIQRKADIANETARLNAELAERARQQNHKDRSAVRNEEAGQLADVIGGKSTTSSSSDSRTSDSGSVDPGLLTHKSQAPGSAPAVAPVQPVAPTTQSPASTKQWLDDRPRWWWIAAVLSGLLLLGVVYPFWPTFPARHITNPHLEVLVVLIAIVWALIHFAIGFTVGGWIAYRIEKSSKQKRQH